VNGRIALGFGAAGLLLMGAFALWTGAIVASAGDPCPAAVGPGGGFESISAWPPGLRCGSGAGETVVSSIPFATAVIAGMAGTAAFLVLLAIGTEIRSLRAGVRTRTVLAEPEPEPPVPLEALGGTEPQVRQPSEAALRVLRDAA
jgi:hypothetical protein